MTVRCHLRRSWIVFLAIVGMSSMAGDAMAGLSGGATKASAELLCRASLHAGLLQACGS